MGESGLEQRRSGVCKEDAERRDKGRKVDVLLFSRCLDSLRSETGQRRARRGGGRLTMLRRATAISLMASCATRYALNSEQSRTAPASDRREG